MYFCLLTHFLLHPYLITHELLMSHLTNQHTGLVHLVTYENILESLVRTISISNPKVVNGYKCLCLICHNYNTIYIIIIHNYNTIETESSFLLMHLTNSRWVSLHVPEDTMLLKAALSCRRLLGLLPLFVNHSVKKENSKRKFVMSQHNSDQENIH